MHKVNIIVIIAMEKHGKLAIVVVAIGGSLKATMVNIQ